MAGKLAKAEDALKKGDMKQAAEQLGMSQQQMSEMAKQLEELQALDSAMADVQEAKNGMAADGMNELGSDMNSLGMSNLDRRKGMGMGLNRGRGQGDRPLAPDETSTYTDQGQAAVEAGQGGASGPDRAGQDRQGKRPDRHPGRNGGRQPARSPTPSPTRRSPRTSKNTSGRITTRSIRAIECFVRRANETLNALARTPGSAAIPSPRPSKPPTYVVFPRGERYGAKGA